MAENLKVTHYNNEDEITHIINDEDWGSYDVGQYGVYDNDPANADIYGNLYNFAVVDDDRGVCPNGWHVPSDAEYTVLTDYLSGTSVAGGKMKEEGLEHWDSPNAGATNESGFTGLPAGYRYSSSGTYNYMSSSGSFWSSSELSSNLAWRRELDYNSSTVYRSYDGKQGGFSIRCLADEITTGCTNPEACNYNPDANANDGSCEYYNPEIMCDCAGSFLDINGDCCSDLIMDECWVCNGDGPAEHYDCAGNCLVELDCAGNCCVLGEEGCYWQETGPCGEPGPSNGMDECGVCGGDNSSCMTCAGVPCSDAYIDNCGVCDDIPENDCVQGCDNIWGSGFELDECDVCDGDGSSCADSDNDGCLDNIDDAPYEWDDDYDGDGLPDDCDADDDNDGAVDYADSDDNSEFACSDVDGDTCDDCSSGSFDPANDGPDMNGNGICDDGDINDSDGDGVIDDEDSDPFNPYQCADNDGDGCDDCGTGYYNPADDGADYDADGICDFGDLDDDNDGTIDSEDCAPLYELAAEVDCCGVCGGDNSSCSNCCGIPFNDDCTSDCYIDYNTGECCYIEEVDECGVCYGDNACLGCEAPFIDMNGHCLHEDDIAVLQAFIDNSVNSDYVINNCSDSSDPWCQSPNLYMDQSANWFDVLIDGTSYTFSNDNGVVEPLELGLQEWQYGRLTSIMCGAYIYCQLSGEIPSSISDLTEINVLRLEVNYFTGYIPESICGFEHLNYEDYLAFDLSYNKLCPPYPDCVPDGAVDYMDTAECGLTGDVNNDNQINVLDIVMIVDFILSDVYNDTGDINGDNTINVIDIVILIDMILNSE